MSVTSIAGRTKDVGADCHADGQAAHRLPEPAAARPSMLSGATRLGGLGQERLTMDLGERDGAERVHHDPFAAIPALLSGSLRGSRSRACRHIWRPD
jgi:hypothetical protein